MDDDYEARMRERAARRAARSAGSDAPATSTSMDTPAPSQTNEDDDYEARMKERALKRKESSNKINQDQPAPTEQVEEPTSSRRTRAQPEPVSSNKMEEEEEEKEEQEEKVEEKVEEQEEKMEEKVIEKEEQEEEQKPTTNGHTEEDSYKPPRSSRRNEIPASRSTAPTSSNTRSATSSSSSMSSTRSTPSTTTSATRSTPSTTTSTARSTSASSNVSSTRSTPSSSTTSLSSRSTPAAAPAPSASPVGRAGRERPVSVASPPAEKKDFSRSNRFSVAPEPANTAPATSEEAPKRKTISLASKTQEAEDIVRKIVEGDEEVGWVLFNCDPNVQIYEKGVGEVEALKTKLDDTMVLYGYLRVAVGAEGRTKFVYIRWVGSKIKPIQRAKALDNEKVIKSFTRVYHIEIHTSEKDELTSTKVQDKLARAGGANYDKSQNVGSKSDSNASFNSYKERSRDFFYEKEREGNVKGVVYEKGPMTRTTPVNLSGRAMTIGAASANKNMVDLKTKK